jgi:hypothetical protein
MSPVQLLLLLLNKQLKLVVCCAASAAAAECAARDAQAPLAAAALGALHAQQRPGHISAPGQGQQHCKWQGRGGVYGAALLCGVMSWNRTRRYMVCTGSYVATNTQELKDSWRSFSSKTVIYDPGRCHSACLQDRHHTRNVPRPIRHTCA